MIIIRLNIWQGTRGTEGGPGGHVRPASYNKGTRERAGTSCHTPNYLVLGLNYAQVFLLIDEATVRRYKADLTDEMEPQINELISRAEKGLQILLKRESMLRAKVSPCVLRSVYVLTAA